MNAAQIAMGIHARHIPLNLLFQHTGEAENRHAGVFQFQFDTDLVKPHSKYQHILVLADAIVRPRIIVGTDELTGEGIASIYMGGFQKVMEAVSEGKADVLFELK